RDPHVSTRQLERESGISRRSILRILHVNQLSENDFQKRLQFCEWGLRKLQDDKMFLIKILFTDEATFTNHGEVNRHYWSVDNPRWLREVDKQRPWSVNFWCGFHNKIIGPYFIDGTLNGRKCVKILKDVLPELLENNSLAIGQSMWFQQDGSPAHSVRNVTEFLNKKFGDRWIDRSGNKKWLARSPNMTSLHFYLWGKLKKQVYREKPTTNVEIQKRMKRACVHHLYCNVLYYVSMFKVAILITCTSSEYVNSMLHVNRRCVRRVLSDNMFSLAVDPESH
ncbi:hypothetical protein WN55_07430, partial [Dufourea novaeangliae]